MRLIENGLIYDETKSELIFEYTFHFNFDGSKGDEISRVYKTSNGRFFKIIDVCGKGFWAGKNKIYIKSLTVSDISFIFSEYPGGMEAAQKCGFQEA